MDWINIFGLIIVALMLVPNIIYACKNRQAGNKCDNKLMNIVEQVGRYGSMFLMSFNIGIAEFVFRSKNDFAIWLMSMAMLLLLYWIFWFFYLSAPRLCFAIVLAVIPSIIFVLSGVLLRHWLLVLFGMVFAVGHLYVTYRNNQA